MYATTKKKNMEYAGTSNTSKLKISLQKRHREEARFYARRYSTDTMMALYVKFQQCNSRYNKSHYLEQMRVEWNTQYKDGPVEVEDEIDERIRMAKSTVRFYLHRINPDTKTKDHLLHDAAFEINELLAGNEPSQKRWMTLITAATQSGKTFLAIALINILLSLGFTPCFIVMSLSQKAQLFKRYVNDTLDLKHYLLTEGFFGDCLDIYQEPIFYNSKLESTQFNEDIQACLNGSRRRLIICIHHEKHLTNILAHLQVNSNIALFIDEAHKLGGYKRIGVTIQGDDLHNPSNKYETALLTIKNHSQKIFLITATPQDILMTEPNLYAYGIVFIPEGVKYRGIPCWQFDIIDADGDKTHNEELMAEVNEDGKRKIIGIPRSFMNMMYNLSRKLPIRRTDKFGRKNYHPINVLARYQPINELQHMTLGSFRSDTKPANEKHKRIIKAKWAVMVFNQYGVRLFHESLRGETITVADETITDTIGNGEFLFKHTEIGAVWHWLGHNGGVKRFPRILNIAYHNASEGISFSSTWTDNPATDLSWHITNGYIRLGSGASSSAMEQAMGRMNGNFGDNIIPRISCTASEKERCIKGHLVHYKWVQYLANLSLWEKDCKVVDYVRNEPLFENHIPKAFSRIPKAIKLLKRKENPNKDIEEESFKKHKKALSTLELMAPEFYDEEKEHLNRALARKEKEAKKEMNEEKFGKYTVIDRHVFGTRTKIYRIIGDVISILIEDHLVGKPTLIAYVNKRLKNTKYSDMDMDYIRGVLWTTVRNSKKLVHTDTKISNSLLYYMNGKGKMVVCLTE